MTWGGSIATSVTRPRKENLMSYVDGFVVAVPTAKKDAYLQMAKAVDVVFKECGALSVVECETVVFSWIMWPDRATRDEGMKKAMADAFDGKRMIFGGFQTILSL
jgi:uncharacterized protein YbaA (DUF1428 family)